MVMTFMLGVMPLWLSSTEMWDGVVGIHALTIHDWDVMKGWILDSNWYLTYAIFILADVLQQWVGLPYWIFFKFWLVLIIVGIAFEVYRLAIQVFEIPGSIALWLPSLVFSFPVWYVFFSYTCMSGHLTCVWLALAGYRLLYSGKKWVMAIGALLVLLSFQLASTCAFILALELGRWLICKKTGTWVYWRSILLLILAIGVFAATRVIWPPVGVYAAYNQFLNPLQSGSWISYTKHAALFATWLVLVLPMGICIWWASRKSAGGLMDALKGSWRPAFFLAFLAISACAPYIAVGLGSPLFTLNIASSDSVSAVLASNSAVWPVSVWYGGWGARHMFLMMISVVIFVAWLATMYQKLLPVSSTRLVQGSIILTICISLAFCVPGHWSKLHRIATEQTIVQALAEKPPMPPGDVNFLLDKRVDYLVYMYEANYLLYKAYKGTSWSALMLPDHAAIQRWGEENRIFVTDQARKNRDMVAKMNLMDNYSWAHSCKTEAKITLPTLSVWDVLWRAEHLPEQLPMASILPVSSSCSGAAGFWR